MNATRLLSPPHEPAAIAKWLLIAFAIGVLACLGGPAFKMLRQGEPDVFFLSFAMLPWLVGPAALATLWAARARSRREAWAFVGAVGAAVASTVWVGILTMVIKTGHANSEYAVGLLLTPVVQVAALLIYALGVIAIADLFVVKDRQQGQPRIVQLVALSILSVALLIVLAWTFGYIKA